ncbi:MAG TPA: fumarylacetoacetate hydrolase family protein [Hyphomicrobiaceae bacterium]|jgi:2-keto-4-pentenoate hydratase/2-oxohepta-3-ene-1,7-dioic acid hydratase in catechol pathway
MKLMMFERSGGTALGLVEGTNVIDLTAADASLPKDLAALIAASAAGHGGVLAGVKAAAANAPGSARLPLATVKAALPIARPSKLICVGLNYALHAKEGGHPIPTYPSFFLRVPTSLTAPGAPVIRPRASIQLDYECELTIVIGKGGRHIPEAKALDHVFGYTLFNDVSVRDFQRKTTQWTPGKNFDSTGPLGPWVVTADELPPGASGLRIATRVNGEVMQDSNTSDMIFSTANIVATLSEFMTLEPGDIIATGTPSGVAHARKPPAWMKAGDRVEVEVEGIGVLSNPIADEA